MLQCVPGLALSLAWYITLTGPRKSAATVSMQALRSLYDPSTQDLLDRALVLRFPAPASFTGLTTPSESLALPLPPALSEPTWQLQNLTGQG